MTIKARDINLDTFLDKFTYTGAPNPNNKIVLDIINFLDFAIKLKISAGLERVSGALYKK